MRNKLRVFVMGAIFIAGLLISLGFVSAQYAYSSPSSYYGDYASTYYGTLSQDQCDRNEGQDFIVEILPGDCSPAVVRSDLLEEQNVPVFCKLTGYKINPLIEIPQIRSVSIASGSYPKDVASITFHPYRAALQSTSTQLIGSSFENNLGYVVLFLKQNPIENNMPKEVVANLSARILYDVTSSFGIGQNQLIIPQLNEEEWKSQYKNYGFWYGKGYVRASQVGQDSAMIQLYFDPTRPATSIALSKNKPSSIVYLPGSECSYGVQATLDDVIYPSVKAVLDVDGNKVEAYSGMRINSKCTVRSIDTSSYGASQSVTLSCSDGTHTLYKSGLTAEFTADSKAVLGIGDSLSVSNENYTVVFMGRYQKGDLAIIEKDSDLTNGIDRSRAIVNENLRMKNFYESGTIATANLGNGILINPSKTIGAKTVSVKILEGVTAKYSTAIENYYQLASTNYEEVVKSWPEVKSLAGDKFGEKALLEKAEMALKLQKSEDAASYYEEFLGRYPDSTMVNEARQKLSSLTLSTDSSKASGIIPGDYADSSVTLVDVREPSTDELSVVLYVNSQTRTLGLGDMVGANWTISNILDNSVTFQRITDSATRQAMVGASAPVVLDEKTNVKISKVNLVKYAKITLDPYSKKGETYANFTVHVGIEKRAIQLSPDKTKSLIGDLDKQINTLTNINNKLSTVVEQWKRACLVGTGALWTWNFFENLLNPGEATARGMIMSKREVTLGGKTYAGGWNEACSDPANSKEQGYTLQQCLFVNRDTIDSDIMLAKDAVANSNEVMDEALGGDNVKTKVGIFGLSSAINQNAYADSLQKVIDSDKTGRYNDLKGKNISGLLKEGRITQSDLRDALFELNVQSGCSGKTEGVCSSESKKVSEILGKISIANVKSAGEGQVDDLAMNIAGSTFPVVDTVSSSVERPALILDGATNPYLRNSTYSNLDSSFKTSKVALLGLRSSAQGTPGGQGSYSYENYLFILGDGRTSYTYDDSKIYKYNSVSAKFEKVTEGAEIANVRRNIGPIKKQEKCDWAYLSKTPEIKFWDSGQYKGLPAVMPLGPFNGYRGFYVATESQGTSLTSGLTSSSTSSAFAESGSPQTFTICNVGENGVPNFGEIGSDDEGCQRFSLAETYASQTTMCGGTLSKTDTSSLVNRAITCMKQASSQYGKATGTLTTNCGTFKIGTGKSSVPNAQCEDFMSPEKCTIMYNLCDPVICPTSRCNWGGRYPVDNVISSGIIGSLIFCSQNAGTPLTNGGVMVPVCLTGINAGLENWISIMNSTRKCLNESLNTGKNVGICDQLKSVYLCEFFWKQINPFIKTGIPYLVESTINKRTGGGEYLTFKDTWDNSISQFNYVTQYYGANALKAFQVRSTEEAGSLICQSFIGLRYPNQGDLFSELSQPESPVQYTAWFDEETYSSVTVPPISHYKVYYHIYAGKDAPAYWSVYLSEPQSYTYPLSERATIASGYLETGGSVDETRDTTLASGYKKLCISINGVAKCDFQKVSTGFGVNELVNYYVQDQTVPGYEITTADQCTSGTSSLLTGKDLATSLVPVVTSPGQGALEETLQPEIFRRGIVRICSQDDPGKGADEGRWSEIGFCDSNRKMRCWLDTSSVKGAISDLNLSGMTIEEAKSKQAELFNVMGTFFNDTTSNVTINALRNNVNDPLSPLSVQIEAMTPSSSDEYTISSIIGSNISLLNSLARYSRYDKIQAEAQLLIGEIYNKVVDRLFQLAPRAATAISQAPGCGNAQQYNSVISNLVGVNTVWKSSSRNYDAATIIEALIMKESSGIPSAVTQTKLTKAGMKQACGLMQMLPVTASTGKDDCTGLLDAQNNLKIGVPLFSEYVKKFSGTDDPVRFALAAWHAGSSASGLEKSTWSEASALLANRADTLGTRTVDYVEDIVGPFYTSCQNSSAQTTTPTTQTPTVQPVKTASNDSLSLTAYKTAQNSANKIVSMENVINQYPATNGSVKAIDYLFNLASNFKNQSLFAEIARKYNNPVQAEMNPYVYKRALEADNRSKALLANKTA